MVWGLLRKRVSMKKDTPTYYGDLLTVACRYTQNHLVLDARLVFMSSANPAFMEKGCLPPP